MMVCTVVNREIKKTIHLNTKMVLVVEYDGTRYHGFQWQAGLPTIQKEIETSLRKLTGEKIRVVAASRTDSGVHAKGQVVSFRTHSLLPTSTFISGLNHYLPQDIAVKSAYRVDDSFRVRGSASSREYRYYILNRSIRSPLEDSYTYQVSGQLDIDTMNQSCQALIGKHDFASFTSGIGPDQKNTVRQVYEAEIKREGELITFRIVAKSFLPHQVRNIVGCLLRIGLGRMSQDELNSIIEARKPGLAGPTIPACGLCLVRVNYPYSFRDE